MWVVQAEATLGVYECLEIVRGTEQDPTPPLNANGNLPPINAALGARINDWNRRHVRARETLLKCLNSAALFAEVKAYDATLKTPQTTTET